MKSPPGPPQSPEAPMCKGYSIRVASRMVGLPIDTLRMWERRYDFPAPTRDSSGNRVYSEADVARLLMISRAVKLGYRAGEAIRLSDHDLGQLSAASSAWDSVAGESLDSVASALLSLFRSRGMGIFRRELRRIAGTIGARRFVTEVAGSLLDAVGQAWSSGELRIFEEHLISSAISSELRLMSHLQENSTGPRILLGTLPREQHALGLEMAALMVSLAGGQVEALGPDAPPSEICQAAESLGVQAIGLSVSQASAQTAVLGHVEWLADRLPPTLGLWLGGRGAGVLDELPRRVRVIRDWRDLEDAVRGLARGL
jgi:MerR family transcriptional regulator, light-induced transcriptional regulator